VSNLLTQTQVTLSRARSVAEYQEVLASNAEEFERLSRMIADMLFLAKADNDLVIPHQEEVDLGREVAGLAEFYEALAEEQGIRLAVEGTARVQGDRLMLRRAIGNLLSNAFAHTPRGGAITVRLSEGGEGPAVTVENSGETIPPEHLPRLFDRFYRADPARQRLSDGVGLGLAITRSIARAHGGEVAVASGNGRSIFTIRLGAPGRRS
jgi:two-component system heavy metal sensor histidine kinase CusS